MKKCAVLLLLFLLTAGCSRPPDEMEAAVQLRSAILQSSACSFAVKITADYGEKISCFAMDCKADAEGDLFFTVTEPETISGITGKISEDGGNLTFDDTALHFALMADEQLSPISAPWILLKTLRAGYITSACTEEGVIRLSVDDSYEEDALRLDIWLNAENKPGHADILHEGRRILSLDVANFKIL